MVKDKNSGNTAKKQDGNRNKGAGRSRTPKITANTPYGECSEQLTSFGGVLALVKFMDLIDFEDIFEEHYVHPKRVPKLGGYRMVKGILMLLFIGFQRLWHFTYIRHDPMLCGILKVEVLPAVTTFWRYLISLTIIQSQSLVRLGGALRRRVWELCEHRPRRVTVNIDTTVSTVYGNIEGARKGHNPKHRGKKALRPVLSFLEGTREYLCGNQRKGSTMQNREVARQIGLFKSLLPDCVKEIRVHADGEFIGWESVQVCMREGIAFTFGNRRCSPPFDAANWYRHGEFEYNECMYQPSEWGQPCRFVAMRILDEEKGDRQLKLLESEKYVYRVFVTNEKMRPHNVIKRYDRRADVENLIGEAKREGIRAIPSKRFQAHHAYFQIFMLAYNLWRWMKLLAGHSVRKEQNGEGDDESVAIAMPDNTLRIARLKMLFVAAKIRSHGNRDDVRYSMHDIRAAGIMRFLEYLDERRRKKAEGRAA